MAEEKNKKPSYEELEKQIEQLGKLVNFYATKANQLEQQMVHNQEDAT